MDKGQMRCDVNLSLRPHGTAKFGTRSETKNVNSLRSVERAARFEIQRHAAVLSSGGTIVQETRHFHEDDGSTTSGRIKDNAEDYRYFPEPDLVPVAPARAWVEELRGTLPELPRVRRNRLREEWGVSELDMQSILNADRSTRSSPRSRRARTRPRPASGGWASSPAAPTSRVCPWRSLRSPRRTWPGSPPWSPPVTSTTSSPVRSSRAFSPVEGTPDEVVEKRGLKVVSDDGALGTAVDEAIAGNAAIADKIRGGKVAAVGALVGAVMKATRGQADAARVKDLILEKLGVSEG